MKKTLLPVIIALIVLVSSLVFGSYDFGTVKASTIVKSTIASDTTWLKTNSPYSLIGQTQIEIGVKLTVEPGVIVDLNGNSLQVNGTLIAQGSVNEKIYFNNGSIVLSNGQVRSDSIIENAVLSDLSGITVDSGSPLVSNNDIKGSFNINGGSPSITNNSIDARIIVKGGSPIISNNKISDGIHADAKGGPVTITKNEITAKSGFTAIYVQGIHADIVGNKIIGNNSIGINGWLRISSVLIEDNQISNCTIGIRADAGANANDMRILRNLIINNSVGIVFWGITDIQNNTIAQNSIGIQCGPSPLPFKIMGNNLQNNSQYNIEHIHLNDLDARNNWWGTTDIQLINQSIFDRKNDSILGEVKFTPFLVAPNPEAPVIPSNLTPLPTMVPETSNRPSLLPGSLPAILLATVIGVLVVTGAGLLVYFKKRKGSLNL